MIYLPYAAILAAFVLIHIPRMAVVGREMAKLDGGYNNRDPRGQQAQLAGIGRRGMGAHNNATEAFAPFAAGVLAALGRGVRVDVVAYLAIAFVVLRTIYMFAYIGDKPALRSSTFTLAAVATVALMVLAITGGPHV
jgi:uncharacterized MAPEG superfamily protein